MAIGSQTQVPAMPEELAGMTTHMRLPGPENGGRPNPVRCRRLNETSSTCQSHRVEVQSRYPPARAIGDSHESLRSSRTHRPRRPRAQCRSSPAGAVTRSDPHPRARGLAQLPRPGRHQGQLRLYEISGDPDVRRRWGGRGRGSGRDAVQDRRPRRQHVLPDLDRRADPARRVKNSLGGQLDGVLADTSCCRRTAPSTFPTT